MNSSRASPTPAFGNRQNSKASCGLPIFIMILTGRSGKLSCRTALETEVSEVRHDNLPDLPVKIMMNIGNPQLAFEFCQLPNAGVGLARLEFIINHAIGVHPKAVLEYPNL